MKSPKYDRWYQQEMRAPDGSYIKRIQDCTPEERRKASEAAFQKRYGHLIKKQAIDGEAGEPT